ncbi:hypothetical protein C1645_830886 [Glomus cerebriforme]|uniref:Uncharacterized protein n=1 Tax=Glomus cerebriforme TaxID=658196 RepID=A0A397SL64_9GLOM|nr:hypothetical protein C1645_830886 [Glomus cerebriforme]
MSTEFIETWRLGVRLSKLDNKLIIAVTSKWSRRRQSYWIKNRKKIKKRFQRKKIAQKLRRTTKDDLYIFIILIINLNLVIYKLYFDVAEEVLIY